MVGDEYMRGFRTHTFAEIAFPPFGYILTLNSRPQDRDFADLTHFTQFSLQTTSDRSTYASEPV